MTTSRTGACAMASTRAVSAVRVRAEDHSASSTTTRIGAVRLRSITASTNAPGVSAARPSSPRTYTTCPPSADGGRGEIGGEARPAGVHRTEQHPHLSGPGAGRLPRLAQPCPFTGPSQERPGVAAERRRQAGLAPDGQRRVLLEDAALQVAQLGTGFESELLGEHRCECAGRPRARPADGPRRRGRGSADSSCAPGRAARAPAVRGRRLPARGCCCRSAPRPGPRRWPSGARRAGPPRRWRSSRRPGRRRPVLATGRGRLPGRPRLPSCRRPRAVAGPPPRAARRRRRRWPQGRRPGGNRRCVRLDHLAVDRRQGPAESGDVVLDRLRRRGRQVIAPERLGDGVGAGGAGRPAGEEGEQPSAGRARDVHLATFVLHREWTEHQHPNAVEFGLRHCRLRCLPPTPSPPAT